MRAQLCPSWLIANPGLILPCQHALLTSHSAWLLNSFVTAVAPCSQVKTAVQYHRCIAGDMQCQSRPHAAMRTCCVDCTFKFRRNCTKVTFTNDGFQVLQTDCRLCRQPVKDWSRFRACCNVTWTACSLDMCFSQNLAS